ncbi:MAG: lysylphosphatidylglycerol synthase transmembrane domain-containing protein [bacterium]
MKIRVLVGFLLSLIFIYFSFWKPDLAALFSGEIGFFAALFGKPRIDMVQLGAVLTHAKYGYLALVVLVLIISLFFRAYRWRIILLPVSEHVSYWRVFAAMNIGYMVNNILPLRMGEIFRAYIIGRSEHISKSSALATIVVERVIDTLAILILLGITIFFFPFPNWIRNGLFYVGAGILLLIAFMVGLLVSTKWTLKMLRIVFKPLPQKLTEQIVKIVESFSGGLEILRSSHHFVAITVHTVILEVCYVISVILTLLAFSLISADYPAIFTNPILASVVLLIIITIGVGLPSAPGAVGTFHGIVAFGVSLFSVPAEDSMGLAIALHLLNVVPLTILGLVCFWGQHFKFSEVSSQLPERSESPEN